VRSPPVNHVEQLPGLKQNEPLAPYTSLKVGGAAELFVAVRRIDEAEAVLRWAAEHKVDCRWLGGGSNLLVAEAGVPGLAARFLEGEMELPTEDEGEVVSGAGRSFPNLARALARAGWSGLEWASNVPGTVGGAVANNAGAFGSCVAETLAWAEVLHTNGQVERLTVERLGYDYRTSRLKRGELGGSLVVKAAFRVSRAPADDALARVYQFQQLRTATQPRQLSAGSVFANPPGDYAGRLIESVGLKGHRLGGAQLSDQHANFVVNLGGATASDVYQLARLAQEQVWRQTGCWLTPEIELIGRWTPAERAALAGPPEAASAP
jgi:UDP-N-acetylmuramate dehydrogenase